MSTLASAKRPIAPSVCCSFLQSKMELPFVML